MATPSEPLLPIEPDRPPRTRLLLQLGGAGVLALAIAAGIVLLRRGDAAPSDSAAGEAPDRRSARAPKTEPGAARNDTPRDAAEDREAKELYHAAEAFERSEPGEYEKRAARWREVVIRFPTSAWARKADEKHRAATASLQAFLDREFESTRKDAQTLAAAGHFLDAIEAIRTYKNAQTRDLLRRRADLEIGVIENASRVAFNETAAKAKDLAAREDYAAAATLFESIAGSAIAEVGARCQTAIAQLKKAAEARAKHLQSRKGEEDRRAFRETIAPKLLGLVRSRQYDDAFKEISAAMAGAANPELKEEMAAERASIADASSFWEAFLKSLRARTGQDVALLLADGKRIAGKVAKLQPDRIQLDLADGSAEVPLDKLHPDLLVGWTLGRSLPADDAVTYVKAALFFFCEGRDDLAKLYLATARELNGPADPAEKVFRGGFLRAAMSLRK